MKRPFLVIGTSFFFAVWLGLLTPERAVLHLSAASAVTALLCLAGRVRLSGKSLRGVAYIGAAVFLAAAIGFGRCAVYNGNKITPFKALEGKTVEMEAFVSEVSRGSSTSYIIKATFPEYPNLPQGVNVILNRAGEYEGLAGDILRLTATIKPAPDTVWYRSRGISLIAGNAKNIHFIEKQAFRFERQIIALREYLKRNIYAKLQPETAGLVSTMTFGLGGEIPQEVYTATTRAGTAHMLVVSGLHVSVFAGCVAAILSRLGAKKKTGAILNIALCFVFCVAAGFGAATARAFVMTSITLIGKAILRKSDGLNSLGAALLFCGAIRPEWTLGWGLWISAGATAGIILFSDKFTAAISDKLCTGRKPLDRGVKYASAAMGVSLAANMLTFPILLMMSGWVSLVAPLANVLVAPFIPAVLFGGMLCAAVPGVSPPVMLAAWVTDFSAKVIAEVSRVFSELPFAVLAVDENWLIIWVLAVAALTVTAAIRGKAFIRYAAMLAVIGFSAGGLTHGLLWGDSPELVSLKDRSMSVVLRGNEAVVLGVPEQYEVLALSRYLRYRGITRIRAIIAPDCGEKSHGSVKRLNQAFGVDCILAPEDTFKLQALQTVAPKSRVLPYPNAALTALGVTFTVTENGEIQLPKKRKLICMPLGTYLFGEERFRLV